MNNEPTLLKKITTGVMLAMGVLLPRAVVANDSKIDKPNEAITNFVEDATEECKDKANAYSNRKFDEGDYFNDDNIQKLQSKIEDQRALIKNGEYEGSHLDAELALSELEYELSDLMKQKKIDTYNYNQKRGQIYTSCLNKKETLFEQTYNQEQSRAEPMLFKEATESLSKMDGFFNELDQSEIGGTVATAGLSITGKAATVIVESENIVECLIENKENPSLCTATYNAAIENTEINDQVETMLSANFEDSIPQSKPRSRMRP